MKKLIFFIPISIIVLIILSGCWDRREVNDLAIAVALGIDKNEDDGYRISVQVLNPSEIAAASTGGGSGYDTPVTTYTTTGDIVFEALRKLTQEVPRKIYLAHIRLIVIGEEVAKEGIYNVLDFLSRDHEIRTNFFIIVSKDCSANDILNVLTSIEKIPANKLYESLESSSTAWAATSKVKLNELMDDIINEGTQPILTAVTILG
ncbi:Ger(x)C family spore germination protein, partial [Butyricicoccus sp. 1XD8-22]